MARQRRGSNVSNDSSAVDRDDQVSKIHGVFGRADQTGPKELGSMYDYLAKIILLGPSGCGKSVHDIDLVAPQLILC